MANAKAKAAAKFQAREVRPTQRLTLAEVPDPPLAFEDRITSLGPGREQLLDMDIDGDPCRWRYDSQGLRVFIRYYPDHATANAFPWKQLYERGAHEIYPVGA